MTSDWGNSTPATAGIYDAPASESGPEEGSMPVATFETSLTELENVPTGQSVEQVLQNQSDGAEAEVSVAEKTPKTIAAESVETVLHEQADAVEAEKAVAVPLIDLDIPEVVGESQEEPTTQDAPGFYSAPAAPAEPISEETSVPATETVEPFQEDPAISVPSTVSANPSVIPSETEESLSPNHEFELMGSESNGQQPARAETHSGGGRDDNVEPVAPVVELELTPEPILVTPATEVQGAPVTVTAPEMPAPLPEPVEAASQDQEVVKDMFEDVPVAPVNDPGLYANTFEDANSNNSVAQPVGAATPQLSREKRTNILILAVGAVLALCLIGGGIWAYIALNKKTVPVVVPVVETPSISWSELRIVDAGFKISFPGQPDKTESTQTIGSLDTPVITESYTAEDTVYTAAYATVNASVDKLPSFVTELATLQNLDVVTTKVGTYFTADAIDFTLGRDSASYQGKIMLQNNTYILIEAGSLTGKATDYDKFIKSFAFLTAGTAGTIR